MISDAEKQAFLIGFTAGSTLDRDGYLRLASRLVEAWGLPPMNRHHDFMEEFAKAVAINEEHLQAGIDRVAEYRREDGEPGYAKAN